jgi:hypothetical protein
MHERRFPSVSGSASRHYAPGPIAVLRSKAAMNSTSSDRGRPVEQVGRRDVLCSPAEALAPICAQHGESFRGNQHCEVSRTFLPSDSEP